MKQGDRVRISGATGTVYGRVEEVKRPGDLPDVPGAAAQPAREALTEMEVSRVAMLSHPHGRQRLLFAALESGGEWYDLKGQPLAIEIIPPRKQWNQPQKERAS